MTAWIFRVMHAQEHHSADKKIKLAKCHLVFLVFDSVSAWELIRLAGLR